jgi:predicted membrane metal-binding protein
LPLFFRIAFGLTPAVAQRAGSHIFVASLFAASVTSLLIGIVLAHFERLVAGGVVSLLCWGLLGLTGACIDEQPRGAEAILSRVDAGTISLSTPLRYYGQLRDEPEKLPWGEGYDIGLSGVDYEGAFVPATGGLRLSYATRADGPGAVKMHAGDRVSVLTQAKLPQVFRDEGALDRRAYLMQQGIDLVATLRAPELLELVKPARPVFAGWTSRARRALGDEIDALWSTQPKVAGVLRAMLLGDRRFVERDEATDFQKTGAFHVLVIAGLHVGAFAVALFWIGRRLRLPREWTATVTLLMLLAYVSVVEQRAPVLRAGLMAAIVVIGGFFFRRLELLNSAALPRCCCWWRGRWRCAMRVFNCRFWRSGASRGWRFPGSKARCSHMRERYGHGATLPGMPRMNRERHNCESICARWRARWRVVCQQEFQACLGRWGSELWA